MTEHISDALNHLLREVYGLPERGPRPAPIYESSARERWQKYLDPWPAESKQVFNAGDQELTNHADR